MNLSEVFEIFRKIPTREEIYDIVREHNSRIFEEQIKESMKNWEKLAEGSPSSHSSSSSEVRRVHSRTQEVV
jgi:arsenate reductase-like glutaredoxin family protein